MNKYDELLEIIISEKKRRGLNLKDFSTFACCHWQSMKSYLYRERRMPADLMFFVLEKLGYELEVSK